MPHFIYSVASGKPRSLDGKQAEAGEGSGKAQSLRGLQIEK